MYVTRIIVTKELPPEDYLYLRCLTNRLTIEEGGYLEQLALDYAEHRSDSKYVNYINEFTGANMKANGGKAMVTVPENVFRFFGTSSDEIREAQRKEDEKFYSAQLQEKDAENSRLRRLLAEHGISAE